MIKLYSVNSTLYINITMQNIITCSLYPRKIALTRCLQLENIFHILSTNSYSVSLMYCHTKV